MLSKPFQIIDENKKQTDTDIERVTKELNEKITNKLGLI